METLHREVPTGVVDGVFAARFATVVDAFVANYAERGEVGASLAITHEGDTVVDVWGGMADPANATPWRQDTVSIVFSCTKGATAICAHVLAAEGKLDLEAPVADYWPEFANGEKADVTVRMMLDHSVGVPALRDPVEKGELYDWDRMVARLEAEPPFWEPGTRNGYHMVNFGWTVGELVRRASGRSLGAYFQDAVAKPLGIDFWIGTPEAIEPRVAPMRYYVRPKGEPLTKFQRELLASPTSIPALASANIAVMNVNTRAAHAAEVGGGNGISNGRGLAGLYTPFALGGTAPNGTVLVDRDGVDRMRRVSTATNSDATLRLPTRFSMGFMVSMDNRGRPDDDSVVLGEHAFGHVGAGGSIGFADPSCGLALGYSMNQMGKGILLNDRGQAVVDAAYRALGYRSSISGSWQR